MPMKFTDLNNLCHAMYNEWSIACRYGLYALRKATPPDEERNTEVLCPTADQIFTRYV